jgi:hypothetical protein
MAPFQMRFGLGISPSRTYDEEEEEEEEDEEFEDYEEDEEEDMEVESSDGTASPPPPSRSGGLVGAVVGALRRSLVMCSAGAAADDDDEDSDSEDEGMEIGVPVDVRHVAHVTFDRFGGFLGLPADLEPDVPRPTPSVRSALLPLSGLCQRALSCHSPGFASFLFKYCSASWCQGDYRYGEICDQNKASCNALLFSYFLNRAFIEVYFSARQIYFLWRLRIFINFGTIRISFWVIRNFHFEISTQMISIFTFFSRIHPGRCIDFYFVFCGITIFTYLLTANIEK